MDILTDIGGELHKDNEIGGTILADHVAEPFAPSELCYRLFAPSENKVAGKFQE